MFRLSGHFASHTLTDSSDQKAFLNLTLSHCAARCLCVQPLLFLKWPPNFCCSTYSYLPPLISRCLTTYYVAPFQNVRAAAVTTLTATFLIALSSSTCISKLGLRPTVFCACACVSSPLSQGPAVSQSHGDLSLFVSWLKKFCAAKFLKWSAMLIPWCEKSLLYVKAFIQIWVGWGNVHGKHTNASITPVQARYEASLQGDACVSVK